MKSPLLCARKHFFRVTLLWCSVGSLFLLGHNFGRTGAKEGKRVVGVSREGAGKERAREARFDASLKRENLRDWMKRLTARPHHLGSAYDKANAEFIASQLRAWGYETEIEELEVLFPTPKLRLLEMTAPSPFTAALKEPALAEDSTSGLVAEPLPTYNAYSIDGDVTSQLVYVNFGVPKDYETLAERGVDVKGKIVIARYGCAWRGVKSNVAAEYRRNRCPEWYDC